MAETLVDYSRAIYNDDEIITEVMNIEASLYGNTNFVTPSPSIATITADREVFQVALAKSIHGTPTDTANKNEKRLILEGHMHVLGAYV
jgi:hypothetical protein